MSKLFSTGIVLNRLTNIVNPDLHYIESFGRVRKLSLKTVKMSLEILVIFNNVAIGPLEYKCSVFKVHLCGCFRVLTKILS